MHVLWTSSTRPLEILTWLDVDRDPIVPQLREWMRTADGSSNPPVYPAVGVPDERPPEPVPEALRAIADDDVWPLIVRVVLPRRQVDRLHEYYRRSDHEGVLAAKVPHDERLRQYRRILRHRSPPNLSMREFSDIFHWNCSRDTSVLKAIVQRLMQRPGGPVQPTSSWYDHHNKVAMWSPHVCLWELRLAVVFITRLRRGGMDLTFLARDIECHGQ